MNPVVVGVLAEAALSLFNKFLESPSHQNAEALEGGEYEYPASLEEFYDQVVAFVNQQDEYDKQQGELVVQLAQNLDTANAKLSEFEERVARLSSENTELVRRAESAERSAKAAESRFTVAVAFGTVGFIVSIVSLALVIVLKSK